MLEEAFNNLSLSNSLIFFLRLVASCYFQQNPVPIRWSKRVSLSKTIGCEMTA